MMITIEEVRKLALRTRISIRKDLPIADATHIDSLLIERMREERNSASGMDKLTIQKVINELVKKRAL